MRVVISVDFLAHVCGDVDVGTDDSSLKTLKLGQLPPAKASNMGGFSVKVKPKVTHFGPTIFIQTFGLVFLCNPKPHHFFRFDRLHKSRGLAGLKIALSWSVPKMGGPTAVPIRLGWSDQNWSTERLFFFRFWGSRMTTRSLATIFHKRWSLRDANPYVAVGPTLNCKRFEALKESALTTCNRVGVKMFALKTVLKFWGRIFLGPHL